MADVQDRYKHWEAREGLIAVGHLPMRQARAAITRSLPTMHHALRLFEAVVEHLGERAWLDPEGGDQRQRLLLRDVEHSDWLVPVPLVEHCWSGARGEHSLGTFINPNAVIPADAPEGWKPGDPWYGEVDPEPEVYPEGPDMRAGEFAIAEGPAYFRVCYDDRGLKGETQSSATDNYTFARYDALRPYTVDPLARPPTAAPLSLLCRDDLDPEGHTIADLAEMICTMEPVARVPARVRLPLPIPGGAEGAWTRACWAMREALWSGRVPASARWLVADGFDGSALAWGDTRAQALERYEAELARVRPRPPGWKPEPEQEALTLPEADAGPRVLKDEEGQTVGFSTGTIRLEAPAVGELAWPMPLPRFTPAVLLPLPPLPSDIPDHLRAAGYRRWVRLLGGYGAVGHGLLREDEAGGFTLIGAGVLDLVTDPEALEEEMDACDDKDRAWHVEAAVQGLPDPWSDPTWPCKLVSYRLWDDGRRERVPARRAGMRCTAEVVARDFDAGVMGWCVTRRLTLPESA